MENLPLEILNEEREELVLPIYVQYKYIILYYIYNLLFNIITLQYINDQYKIRFMCI